MRILRKYEVEVLGNAEVLSLTWCHQKGFTICFPFYSQSIKKTKFKIRTRYLMCVNHEGKEIVHMFSRLARYTHPIVS